MFNSNTENVKLKLNNGALLGLSEGAKMNVKSAIVEFVDNAEDANASRVDVIFDYVTNKLQVCSIENTNLEKEDYEKIFNLGVGRKIKTIKNGVGKYSQGFKYAGPCLIGEGNRGSVIVCVKPMSGRVWSAIQFIDYTDPDNYKDEDIKITGDISEMSSIYNFMVQINGCKKIERKELDELRVELGIRYRIKLQNKATKIFINGKEVLPQDRLYSKFGVMVSYHEPKFYAWNGDEKAISVEWSDVRDGVRKYDILKDSANLIAYDNGEHVKDKRVSVSDRSCFEIAIQGISIIYDGELYSLIGVKNQPSSAGLRGRINILNSDLADKLISGGNKSNCVVNNYFRKAKELETLRNDIAKIYNNTINKYKESDDESENDYKAIPSFDKWCDDKKLNCRFRFGNKGKQIETFIYDEKFPWINVNTGSTLMESFKNDKARELFMISLVEPHSQETIETIFKKLKRFKNLCEDSSVI
jgi:hypothetical protein